MKNDGGPAFPLQTTVASGKGGTITMDQPHMKQQHGMTLRDYFAAAALQGICANPDITKYATEKGYKAADVRVDFARSAYAQADEMLAERDK